MTGTVPDFLQDEFTQEAWDSLTDAEREGMLGDESEEEQQQSEEEQQQQVDHDRFRYRPLMPLQGLMSLF